MNVGKVEQRQIALSALQKNWDSVIRQWLAVVTQSLTSTLLAGNCAYSSESLGRRYHGNGLLRLSVALISEQAGRPFHSLLLQILLPCFC